MRHPALAGYSILVLEDEPFIAHCLELILKGGGAKVHATGSVAKAEQLTDDMKLSAAVLGCKHGIRSDDVIASRLTGRGLPFVLYGAEAAGPCAAWPNAPVMSKLVTSAEIIETLRGLLQSARAKRSNTLDGKAPPTLPVRALSKIDALARQGTLARRPDEAPDRA